MFLLVNTLNAIQIKIIWRLKDKQITQFRQLPIFEKLHYLTHPAEDCSAIIEDGPQVN
jgi:hypothetical protein